MTNSQKRHLRLANVKYAPSLTLTQEQMAETFAGFNHGDMVTIAGRKWEDGAVHTCEPGDETPFCLRVVQ